MTEKQKIEKLKESVVNFHNNSSIMNTEDYVKLSDAIAIVKEADEIEIGKSLRFT